MPLRNSVHRYLLVAVYQLLLPPRCLHFALHLSLFTARSPLVLVTTLLSTCICLVIYLCLWQSYSSSLFLAPFIHNLLETLYLLLITLCLSLSAYYFRFEAFYSVLPIKQYLFVPVYSFFPLVPIGLSLSVRHSLFVFLFLCHVSLPYIPHLLICRLFIAYCWSLFVCLSLLATFFSLPSIHIHQPPIAYSSTSNHIFPLIAQSTLCCICHSMFFAICLLLSILLWTVSNAFLVALYSSFFKCHPFLSPPCISPYCFMSTSRCPQISLHSSVGRCHSVLSRSLYITFHSLSTTSSSVYVFLYSPFFVHRSLSASLLVALFATVSIRCSLSINIHSSLFNFRFQFITFNLIPSSSQYVLSSLSPGCLPGLLALVLAVCLSPFIPDCQFVAIYPSL